MVTAPGLLHQNLVGKFWDEEAETALYEINFMEKAEHIIMYSPKMRNYIKPHVGKVNFNDVKVLANRILHYD